MPADSNPPGPDRINRPPGISTVPGPGTNPATFSPPVAATATAAANPANPPSRPPRPSLQRDQSVPPLPSSEHLRHILERPASATSTMPPAHPPPSGSGSRGQDLENSRRIKRRKLDSDLSLNSSSVNNPPKGFRYGRYGQVEPGSLRMEIAYCDPATFRLGVSYSPFHMLHDHALIYCAKSNRCNVILRHQGGTVFNLKELAIKTPRNLDFTSPVSDGAVFVSMGHDDLLSRTTQYEVPFVDSNYGPSNGSYAEAIDLLLDPDTDTQDMDHPSPNTRQNRRRMSRAQLRRNRLLQIRDPDDSDSDSDSRVADIPKEWAKPSKITRATAHCGFDQDLDDIERRIQAHDDDRGTRLPNHIGFLPFEADASELDGVEDLSSEDYVSLMMRGATQHRNAVLGNDSAPRPERQPSSGSALADAWQASQPAAAADHERGPDDESKQLMVPVAKFCIDKESNKVTIKFDPPVFGRFILIKMWNPQYWADRVSVHSLVVKGFAGPRYVPVVQLC